MSSNNSDPFNGSVFNPECLIPTDQTGPADIDECYPSTQRVPRSMSRWDSSPTAVVEYIVGHNEPALKEHRVIHVDAQFLQIFRRDIQWNGHVVFGPEDSYSSMAPKIPQRLLDEVRKQVSAICKSSGSAKWKRPEGKLSEALHHDFSGWEIYFIKLHQLLAQVMLPSDAEQEVISKGQNLVNLGETLTLWTSIQKFSNEEPLNEFSNGFRGFLGEGGLNGGGAAHYRYQDYVTSPEAAAAGGPANHPHPGSEASTKASTTMAPPGVALQMATGSGGTIASPGAKYVGCEDSRTGLSLAEYRDGTFGGGSEVPGSRVAAGETTERETTERAPSGLFLSLQSGVWGRLDREGEADGEGLFRKMWGVSEDGTVMVVVVDVDYLCMAISATGRFDMYLASLLAQYLRDAPLPMPSRPPPLLCNSWDMCKNRALHGSRIFVEAMCNYRMTQGKYDWYVTLLTSGSLQAVLDTFSDLANDIWHTQFTKNDLESCKKLERVLIALLGHQNDMVRSQAAVSLNSLYDQHDWQGEIPFLPVVRCVGDAFKISVTLNHEADPNKQEKPHDVFLILLCPSFDVACNFEVYSYYTLDWKPACREAVRSRLFQVGPKAENQPRQFTWTGEADFGSFPRCGFFDWRVVRCDIAAGSWSVVQCTIGELKERYVSSYSFVNLAGDPADGAAGHTPDSFSFRSRNLWPELGRLSDARDRLLAIDENASPFRTLPLQGRFIVQPREMRKHQIHELAVDQFASRFAADGKLLERGSFAKVSSSLSELSRDGVTAVELSGCLSRDNGEVSYTPSGVQVYERPDASPFAVTCRATPCQLLGGDRGFADLVKEASRHEVKLIVDATARVSSSRCHRKYWPHILHGIDQDGKRVMLYGSDGRSMKFEESCQLNYRKVETWDLLVNDISAWHTRLKADGVRLDNAHEMPQLLEEDEEELNRVDPDGSPHYTPEEKLRGETVLPGTEASCGYWSSTAAASHWPNPLIVRLCRALWRCSPNFIIIGDCSMATEDLGKRPGVLARSGVIPQLQSLPEVLSKIFGKTIEPTGAVANCSATSASTLSQWFESTHECLPEGAVVIQSSCSHSSPLPALLYGRGAWPATDYLFFSSDIPATCMGEDEGRAYRQGVSNIFRSPVPKTPPPTTTPTNTSRTNPTKRKSVNVSKRVTTEWQRAATSVLQIGNFVAYSSPLLANMLTRVRALSDFQPITKLQSLETTHANLVGPTVGFDLKKIPAHYKHRRKVRGMFQIFSEGILFPLVARSIATNEEVSGVFAFCRFLAKTSHLALAAINFSETTVTNVGLNLRFLSRHLYAQGLSASRIVEVWDLFAMGDHSFDEEDSTASKEAIRSGKIEYFFDGTLRIMSLGEALVDTHRISIKPYQSSVLGMKWMSAANQEAPEAVMGLYVSALTRLEEAVQLLVYAKGETQVANFRRTVAANYAVMSLVDAINAPNDVSALAETLRHIERAATWRREVWEQYVMTCGASDNLMEIGEKIGSFSLFKLLVDADILTGSSDSQPNLMSPASLTKAIGRKSEMADRLFSKVERILESIISEGFLTSAPAAGLSVAEPGGTPRNAGEPALASWTEVQKACSDLKIQNQLGPIVFMTVELGKWSVVGGLGVMVDELSQTMANELGQEVCVISPYYHWNRKGETDYLKKDGIEWKFNINIALGRPNSPPNITVGVHEGTLKGVRLIFLHNESFFPYPYPDNHAAEAVKLLTVIGKSFLEVLCQLKLIPQLIVTNDWATGLVPAYAKGSDHQFFGEVFDNTTCVHILHNFDPAYEGRIYPPNRAEDFTQIHGLKRDLLIDPEWAEFIVNPSRCALLCCDNWGTVSRSYREDLRGTGDANHASPLAYLLTRFSKPFATPNGIPIAARMARIQALPVASHDQAKGAVQKTYFGFEKPDISIPIFAFIGRITAQKGVHLILEAAESVIKRYNYRVQIVIGGKVNWKDPYSARCGNHMISLRDRYPWSFWADPNEFFNDGTLVNLAADFGLMPSSFEPGGIVQHEFFIAGTPVVAFRTGGLKDTVFEFDLETSRGNGFNFSAYNLGDFIFAFERAHRVYQDTEKYKKLRKNAEASVISCETCASAWLGEFCRLRKKILVNPQKIKESQAQYPKWIPSQSTAGGGSQILNRDESVKQMVRKMLTQRRLNMLPATKNTDSSDGGYDATTSSQNQPRTDKNVGSDEFDYRTAVLLKFVPKQVHPGRRPRSVAVSGSFDDWRVRRPLAWDNAHQAFCATLALPSGKHVYKFIVDGDWVCYDGARIEVDAAGIVNNVLLV